MVDHLAGRYGSAIENFHGAIELGEELNDRHTIAFDLVYLGECHLFRGESKAAKAAFDRALGIKVPSLAPLKAMVEARKALLSAQRWGEQGAEGSSASSDVVFPSPPLEGNQHAQPIGYLEAWNKLFLGWAERLSRRFEAAEAHLEEARAFFNRALVPLGSRNAAHDLSQGPSW
jgi:tetratricopeptide (TPR) repeat protein